MHEIKFLLGHAYREINRQIEKPIRELHFNQCGIRHQRRWGRKL